MTYDPASLSDAAECLRDDLLVAAALELSAYVTKTAQADQSEFLELFTDWGFDPLEWLMMDQADRVRVIQVKANQQRQMAHRA